MAHKVYARAGYALLDHRLHCFSDCPEHSAGVLRDSVLIKLIDDVPGRAFIAAVVISAHGHFIVLRENVVYSVILFYAESSLIAACQSVNQYHRSRVDAQPQSLCLGLAAACVLSSYFKVIFGVYRGIHLRSFEHK